MKFNSLKDRLAYWIISKLYPKHKDVVEDLILTKYKRRYDDIALGLIKYIRISEGISNIDYALSEKGSLAYKMYDDLTSKGIHSKFYKDYKLGNLEEYFTRIMITRIQLKLKTEEKNLEKMPEVCTNKEDVK